MNKHLKTFSKAQVTALVAGVVDFGSLALFTEILKFFYPVSVALGAFLGAVTNFLLNRHWAFQADHSPVGGQAFRYALVSVGSLALNTGGVYLVTENCHLHYFLSKILIAIAIALFYNYPLQRFFVYEVSA